MKKRDHFKKTIPVCITLIFAILFFGCGGFGNIVKFESKENEKGALLINVSMPSAGGKYLTWTRSDTSPDIQLSQMVFDFSFNYYATEVNPNPPVSWTYEDVAGSQFVNDSYTFSDLDPWPSITVDVFASVNDIEIYHGVGTGSIIANNVSVIEIELDEILIEDGGSGTITSPIDFSTVPGDLNFNLVFNNNPVITQWDIDLVQPDEYSPALMLHGSLNVYDPEDDNMAITLAADFNNDTYDGLFPLSSCNYLEYPIEGHMVYEFDCPLSETQSETIAQFQITISDSHGGFAKTDISIVPVS